MEIREPRKLPIKVAVAIIGCLLAGWVIYFFFQMTYLPQPGSVIDLRGRSIALLRLPIVPVEEIEVYEDGEAIRYGYPVSSSPMRVITLSADEQRQLMSLLDDWCLKFPTFRPLDPSEEAYDLGIRCGSWPVTEIKQARIPIDALPPPFAQLIAQLPPVMTPAS
jgi:hypothetical protein